MNHEIALAVDRVGRSRAAANQRLFDRFPIRHTAGATTHGALEVGARVFDLVTGQEGKVIGGTRENFIVPAAQRRNG